MGRGHSRAPWRTPAFAVLAPFALLLLLAVLAGSAAARVHAPLLRSGSWGWLADAALALDASTLLAALGLPAALRAEATRRSGIGDVDDMTGGEFEARLDTLFTDLGYAVTRTGASGDFGADLVVERDGARTVVQAKRYDGTVGIEAVQQVIGATRYYGAAHALVVTNSTCTPAAVELAAAHDVELVERGALVGLLAAHPLGDARPRGPALLGRELAEGALLLGFVAGRLLRLSWRVLRTAIRGPIAPRRSRR